MTRSVLLLLCALSCTPAPVPDPVDAPILEPDPDPVPPPRVEPVPVDPVTFPRVVERGEPFIVRYCGPDFDSRVSILFDGRFDAGGLMGWSDGCKTQTIDGLNVAGNRTMQFVVDDSVESAIYSLTVL